MANKSYNYGRGAYGALAYAGLPVLYDYSSYSRIVKLSTPPLQIKSFYVDKVEGVSPKIGDPVQIYWKDESLNFKSASSIISMIEDDIMYDGYISYGFIIKIDNPEYFKFEEKFIIDVSQMSNLNFYKVRIIGNSTMTEYGFAIIGVGETAKITSNNNMFGSIQLKESDEIFVGKAIYNPFKYKITLFNGITINSLIEERYKVVVGWGANSNSSQKIYLSERLGYIKDIIDSVSEKNYLDLSISETGVIELNRTITIPKENILEIDNSSPIIASSPKFTRDGGKVANKIIYTGYKETGIEDYTLKIDSNIAKDNLYFKLPDTSLGKMTEEFNNGSIIVEYVLLGNGENYSFKQDLYITEGYYKEISIPVSRSSLISSDYAIYSRLLEDGVGKFSQLNKSVSDVLNLNTIFLYFKGDKTVTLHIDTVKKTISNLDLRNLETYEYEVEELDQILFNYCVMVTSEDVVLELPITKDFVNSKVIIHRGDKDVNLYFGDIYFVGSWATDSYLELKVIESPNNYFLSELIERNQEVSYTTKKQLSKVYCKLTDAITNQEVFLLSGSGDTFQTSSNFHSDNLIQYLDYDLRYLEVKNQKTGNWLPLKIKSYTQNSITFYESVTLGEDYIISGEKCEVRRVFITTDSTLSQKSVSDDIYEAYIIKDRYAFGFNYKIDEAHIDNVLNGALNEKGYVYSLNRLIGAEYNLEKSVAKVINNPVSSEENGTIIDLVTQQYTEKSDFDLAVVTEANYRSESVLKLDLSLKYSEIPSDIGEIKLIRYNNPRYGLKNYRVISYQANIRRKQCNDEKAFTIDITAEEVVD